MYAWSELLLDLYISILYTIASLAGPPYSSLMLITSTFLSKYVEHVGQCRKSIEILELIV
jgi:hypothetical protein